MLEAILNLLRKWLGFPDPKEIDEKIIQPLEAHLKRFERRSLSISIFLILLVVVGFCLVIGCLENGFHWKYLLQI